LSKRLVHLVDDDDAVRRSLARLLVLIGYAVKEYASGAELLEQADSLAGGCVLLDLNMPDADGLAVYQALRDRSIKVPVAMITGDGATADLSIAGVAGVLHKPFARAELESLLGRLFASQAGSNDR